MADVEVASVQTASPRSVTPVASPSAPPSSEPMCSECDVQRAVVKCTDCSRNGVALFLCNSEVCFGATHGKVTRETHRSRLVPWDADEVAELQCPHHPGYALHYQCAEEACNSELVCLRCERQGQHHGHRLVDVQDVQKSAREELRQHSEEIANSLSVAAGHREKLEQHRRSLCDKSRQQALLDGIAHDFNDIREVLSAKEEELIEAVNSLYDERIQQANGEAVALQDYMESAELLRHRIASICERDAAHAQRVVLEAAGLRPRLKLERPVPAVWHHIGFEADVHAIGRAIRDGIRVVGTRCRDTAGVCQARYTPCTCCGTSGCASCMMPCTHCNTSACGSCMSPCKNCSKPVCKKCTLACFSCNIYGCAHCMAVGCGCSVFCRRCSTPL